MVSRPLRGQLAVLAVAYVAATFAYSVLWMRGTRFEPAAEIGVGVRYEPASRDVEVTTVRPGSPAAAAGLSVGDSIRAVNGRHVTGPFLDPAVHGAPGDRVRLEVQRKEGTVILMDAVLASRQPAPRPTAARLVAIRTVNLYPVPFAVLIAVVLLLRYADGRGWLLALLFGSLIASAPLLAFEGHLPPGSRGFALAYKVLLGGLTPALFYAFFAVFPGRAPIDRRHPWLKWALLGPAVAVALPLAAAVLAAGGSHPLRALDAVVPRTVAPLLVAYSVGGLALGLGCLVWSAWRGPAEARRKTRVVVWGTVVGITPSFVLTIVSHFLHRELGEFPFWVWVPSVIALFVMPLSFAYALLKHRVLDVPVLLRRSARYVLVQHGFVALAFFLSLGTTIVFVRAFARFAGGSDAALPTGVALGVGLGVVLASAGAEAERRVTRRIDRAFFRSAYDAREILEDLAKSVRVADDRGPLAALLERHMSQALHPRTLAVYFRTADGVLTLAAGSVPPGAEALRQDAPLLAELGLDTRPREVRFDGRPPEVAPGLEAECLVPMVDRGGRLAGLLVLGPRLSEEPYSREDMRLLASVALQAGLALENMFLAETMAARIETERRTAREMEIARGVQSQLLPQRRPSMRTLEYDGCCKQARAVGGDYFDYLDAGAGRLGLVIADISGKGISAALLMANLQANLRSQYAVAGDDLRALLVSLNRAFYESTAPSHFATLFLGDYDDATRRLRYGNCGHNPPLVFRARGGVERLDPTAPAVGLMDDWDCTIGEICLEDGDLLVAYSDGATEALSDQGEEFGEARLVQAVATHRDRPVPELLRSLAHTVELWTGAEQEDDLTLLVARAGAHVR